LARESETEAVSRVAAIVNPAAGSGRSVARWEHVRRRLSAAGISSETFITSFPGEATELARRATAQSFETIVAVGGDGTVHEVINGIGVESLPHVRLGVVPAGTGMDFVRNVGLPRTLRKTSELLVRRHERRIDLGVCASSGQLLFANFAETGLGAAVVAREATFSDAWPGRVSFFLAALAAASSESNTRASITVDGETIYDGPLVSAVVANGRYFAGGMKVAPKAAVADGQLDVLILGDFSKAQLISQIWKIYPGFHVSHPKVLFVRGRRVSIAPSAPSKLDLDGELYGSGPYEFSVLPAALRVVT
jgi:diacylglycerol kinase (ATP)